MRKVRHEMSETYSSNLKKNTFGRGIAYFQQLIIDGCFQNCRTRLRDLQKMTNDTSNRSNRRKYIL